MATQLERTITVPGEIGDVFAYVADFSNAAEWDPGVVRSVRKGSGPLRRGDRFELVASFAGRELETTYETTAYEPPNVVRFEGGTARFHSVDTITFAQVDDGVEIGYAAVFELSFPMSLAEPFLKARFEKIADDAVAGLKDVLTRRVNA